MPKAPRASFTRVQVSLVWRRTNKIDSAVSATGLIGFTAGLLCALILILLPALLVG